MYGYHTAGMFQEHFNAQKTIYNVIYLFHMPLYFVISGYVFSIAYCKAEKLEIRKVNAQIVNLCWNYLLWSLLFGGFKIIFASRVNSEITVQRLLLLPIKAIDLYWYLYVLIVLYLLAVICKSIHVKRIYTILLSILLIGIYALISLPDLTIFKVLPYAFFFITGMSMAEVKNIRKSILVTVDLVCLLICIWSYVTAIREQALISWTDNALIGGITAFAFSILLFQIFMRFGENKKVHVLDTVGKYGLEIYVMHCFITAGNRSILPKLGVQKFVPAVLLNFAMAVMIPIMAAVILKKVRIKKTNLHTLIFRPSKALKSM